MKGTVVIGGKKYETVSKYKAWRKLNELYPDIDKATEWPMVKYHDYVLDCLMLILVNSQFKTRDDLIDELDMSEMQSISKEINTLIFGDAVQDTEGKKENLKN